VPTSLRSREREDGLDVLITFTSTNPVSSSWRGNLTTLAILTAKFEWVCFLETANRGLEIEGHQKRLSMRDFQCRACGVCNIPEYYVVSGLNYYARVAMTRRKFRVFAFSTVKIGPCTPRDDSLFANQLFGLNAWTTDHQPPN
jgi:hypothetical protein